MRTLRIRQWMLVGIVIFAVSATGIYHVADAFDRRVLQPLVQDPSPRQDAALDAAQREITGNTLRWRDPAWQTALRKTLATLDIGGVLYDSSGAAIFRTDDAGAPAHPAPWYETRPSRQLAIVEGGQRLGTVALFAPPRVDVLPRVAAALAIVLALLFVRWQMDRAMIRPLEAMGRAARQIAGGDLNFTLPPARVREVAEVRDAFEAMGVGLRESIGRQAALEEERRFFIGAIAHDLRTPLFALRGYLVGLEQGLTTSPEQTARYVALSRQRADHLDRLVSDLYAYTQVEYLEQTLHCERLDLGPLLASVVNSLMPQAAEKGVTITRDGPEDGAVIEGDAHLLERAVENVLDNALRHTPPGGTIAVRWQTGRDRVTFAVTDTGPGIAAHDLPHLFEPLYRGEASRNRDTGGVGLGLTIARRILRAHGGDLIAANGLADGAQFTGWLPCSPAVAMATAEPTVAMVGSAVTTRLER